jgi:hypothetical protein
METETIHQKMANMPNPNNPPPINLNRMPSSEAQRKINKIVQLKPKKIPPRRAIQLRKRSAGLL